LGRGKNEIEVGRMVAVVLNSHAWKLAGQRIDLYTDCPVSSLLSCGYDVAMPPYDSWGGIATS